jgi:hypothetical protein
MAKRYPYSGTPRELQGKIAAAQVSARSRGTHPSRLSKASY